MWTVLKVFFFYPGKPKREINYVIKVLSSISKVVQAYSTEDAACLIQSVNTPLSVVRTTHCSRHRLTIRHAHTKYLEL